MNNLIKDIKLVLSDKRVLVALGCLIVAICVISGTYRYNNASNKGIKIGIVNNDDSRYSKLLLNFFKSNESFSELATIIEDNENTITSEFNSGNIDAYMIIPESFADSLINIENTRIKIRINQEKEVEAVMLKAILNSYEKYVTSVQNNSYGLYKNLKKSGLPKKENMKINFLSSMEMVYMVLDKESFFDYKIVESNSINIIQSYLYVLIYIFIIFFGVYIGVSFIKEKDKGVFKLYKISKGNWGSLILSKIMIYSLIIDVIVITACKYICNFMKKDMNISVILLLMLNTIFYVGIMIMLSLIIGDKNSYILIVNSIVMFIIILGGGIIPKQFMPDNLKILVDKLPLNIFVKQLHMSILNNTLINDLKSIMTYIAAILITLIMSIMLLERRCIDVRN